MYARVVSGKFKPGKYAFATDLLENKVIPLLKDQPGFCDEISFFNKEDNNAVAISFWKDLADLERYERESYPKIHEFMAEAFEDQPMINRMEVGNSTWYKIHAH